MVTLLVNVSELLSVEFDLTKQNKFFQLVCKVQVALFYIFLSASLNLVVVLSADRFYATYFPYKYKEHASIKNTNKVACGAMIVAVIMGSPFTAIHTLENHSCFGVASYVTVESLVLTVFLQRLFMVFCPALIALALNFLVILRLLLQSPAKRSVYTYV